MHLLTSITDWFRSDARHFQIVAQVSFLCYGILLLGWDADHLNYLAAFGGSLLAQGLAIRFAGAPMHSLKSAMITSLGLSLLLRANSPWLFLFAALFAIGQKFLIRVNGKHLWNPADFGIVLLLIAGGDAWVSPGQWGNAAILVFIIGTAGLAVLSRVKRMETGIAFILSLAILEYARTILYLGWDHEVFLHKITSGSLWLFTFFMITDPMTNPDSRTGRIVWGIGVAIASFILSNFYFINAAPLWVLFFSTPWVPLVDRLSRGQRFQWLSSVPHVKPHTSHP